MNKILFIFLFISQYVLGQSVPKGFAPISLCKDTLQAGSCKTLIKDAPSLYNSELPKIDLVGIAYKKLCPTKDCLIDITDAEILRDLSLFSLHKSLLKSIEKYRIQIEYSGIVETEILIFTKSVLNRKKNTNSLYQIRIIEEVCQNNKMKIVPCSLKAEAKMIMVLKNKNYAGSDIFCSIIEKNINDFIYKTIH